MENKNDFVTKRYLDKKLEEHSQVLVSALDEVLVRRLKDVKDELKDVKDELKKEINNVQTLIDGYVKAQEEFKQEFVIMKEEIRKIKNVIREKLGIEIKAF